jgi:hypothetical protein
MPPRTDNAHRRYRTKHERLEMASSENDDHGLSPRNTKNSTGIESRMSGARHVCIWLEWSWCH